MMKRILLGSLLALALPGLSARAWVVNVQVACPNDTTASGIEVCVEGVGCATTDELGLVTIGVFDFPTNYTVCVTESTLPAGATLAPLCQNVDVIDGTGALVTFTLGGDFCS